MLVPFIQDLLYKDLPFFTPGFTASSPHIHKNLDDIECQWRPLGLLPVQPHIKNPFSGSSFLTEVSRGRKATYDCEGDVERFVRLYLSDLVEGLGLDDVSVEQALEVLRFRPDIWILTKNQLPFLIVEVKKHADGILSDPSIVSHLGGYLNLARHYFGLAHVFGVLTTMNQFRICWLPDCDACAASESIDNPVFGDHLSSDVATELHGTKVFPGSDIRVHQCLISVILKAYHSAYKEGHPALPPLSRRYVIKTDTSKLYFRQLSLDVTSLAFNAPHKRCENYLLLKDCKHGAQGRVWMASSVARNKVGKVCMLKFFVSTYKKRPIPEKVLKEQATKEEKFWQVMGFDMVRVQQLYCDVGLMMPFAVTAKNAVEWDRENWELIKNLVSETDQTRVETALSSVSPVQALDGACGQLVVKGIWHRDIQWRHVSMVVSNDNIVASFIDYGNAEYISDHNRDRAVADIEQKSKALKEQFGLK